ncbi:IS66 family transposase [Variovorax rhizosphaerae]|uniref:IS66 family transposase n=1 Tax=Variovorax rhizosphaerae TaxID=1836200 RepID=UPI003BF59093
MPSRQDTTAGGTHHLPLYRQSEIYARSGVQIPRSSMGQWIGICGVRLAPLVDALKDFILGHDVVHADETPVPLLAPDRGKMKKASCGCTARRTSWRSARCCLTSATAARASIRGAC